MLLVLPSFLCSLIGFSISLHFMFLLNAGLCLGLSKDLSKCFSAGTGVIGFQTVFFIVYINKMFFTE